MSAARRLPYSSLPPWLALMALLAAASLVSAQTASLPLLRPDGLVGWEAKAATGWSNAGGVLRAADGADPLAGQWAFRFGTLSFAWRGAEGSTLSVELLNADGDRAALVSADGDPSETAGWRSAAIDLNRTGHPVWPVFHATGPVAIREVAWSADDAGEPIFNGENLDGWWTPGNRGAWVVDGDELLCTGDGGNYLRTDREYGDFVLTLSYQMERGTNSGVGIRTPRDAWPSGAGMELQIYEVPLSRPVDKHSTMAIYGNLEPLARAERIGEWNDLTIVAQGPIVAAWVNGVLVQHADVRTLSELQYRNGAGWIGFQDHGARIRFRDIRVAGDAGRSIDPAVEPDRIRERAAYWLAWPEATADESSAFQILDGVLNPGRLAESERPGGRTVSLAIGDRWIDLPGPGAVVRIDAAEEAGLIEFFVDGEAAPSISGFYDQLHERLPLVGEDAAPLATWLPFRRSLRVRAGNMSSPNVRLAYVRLPEDEPASTFEPPAYGIPRGVLSAANYRFNQLDNGTRRRLDPMEQAVTERSDVAPGESLSLELSGAGVIRTLTFLGDPRELLAGGATIRMESIAAGGATDGRPDVDVPLNVLLAGLADGGWNNFVVTGRDEECTSLLAVPFAGGLRITLVNKGETPLRSVGIDAAVDRRASTQELTDARLRTIHAASANEAPGEAELTGRGRLAGVVMRTGPEFTPVLNLTEGIGSADAGEVYQFFWPTPANDKLALSGQADDLVWEWTLLAAPSWRRSARLKADDDGGEFWAFYYELPSDRP